MSDPIKRTAKGKRPVYFDTAIDQLIDMNVAMAAEISVLRDRIAAIESVAAGKDLFSTAEIDAHAPEDAERQARESQRRAMLARLFGGLQASLDAAAGSHAKQD